MNYSQELINVLNATKEKVTPEPILLFKEQGWWFNGVNYGDNRKAAEKARDDYYDPDDLKDVL